MHQVISCFGYFVMIFLAWLMSSHRNRFPWRVVIGGTLLQISFALVILYTQAGRSVFELMGAFFMRLLSFVDAGSRLVFGQNYQEHLFAFRVLPVIIFFSALMAVLYHLGIMQIVVRAISVVMRMTLKTSGAESLSASANIFVGQTEAPLVIRPYVAKMTRSELMAVMVGGFATIAGSVMAAYVEMGISAAHLLTASVISAPAGLLIAKVLQPEVEVPQTLGVSGTEMTPTTGNLIEAVTTGTSEGLSLALNVGAMLIAFLSLIALIDFSLGHTSVWMLTSLGIKDPVPWTMTRMLGTLFSPIAWLMGIEWKECRAAGELLGLKLVATEFVAYERLGGWMAQAPDVRPLSDRAAVIVTYALCGFSNFASIGIQIGGIGALAPERRRELTEIAFRAMLGGSLACCMTACIAGMLWQPPVAPAAAEESRERSTADTPVRKGRVFTAIRRPERLPDFILCQFQAQNRLIAMRGANIAVRGVNTEMIQT
jgi:concentrative nucleoside transporter, CNT family